MISKPSNKVIVHNKHVFLCLAVKKVRKRPFWERNRHKKSSSSIWRAL